MSVYSVYCPRCQQKHNVRSISADTIKRCDNCGERFKVPRRPLWPLIFGSAFALAMVYVCVGSFSGPGKHKTAVTGSPRLAAVEQKPDPARKADPPQAAPADEPPKRLEEERKAIFWELQFAGRQAANESDAHFGLRTGAEFGPDDAKKLSVVKDAYMDLTDKIEGKYKDKIMLKYKLIDTERLEIQAEGFTKRWPFPTREQAADIAAAKRQPPKVEGDKQPEREQEQKAERDRLDQEVVAKAKREAAAKAKADADVMEEKATRQLSFAQQLIDNGKAEDAAFRLRRLIKEYPDTKAAEKAAGLLKKLP